ncbi:hypothetical protein F5Y08DRAFT_317698 [Xylaria arbuscula]|nr:hypothetical protein F5Y08DRAFT_317698 [Xylaria arbuscula]
MPAGKRAPAAAILRTRAAAGGQPPSRERKTPTQRQRQHTRRSAQDELFEQQTDPEKILRNSRVKRRGSVFKVPDSDNILAPKSADCPTLLGSIESPLDSTTGYQTEDPEDDVYSVEEDLQESWYTSVGYLPALDESTFDILEQVLSPRVMASIKKALYKSKPDRALGLSDRNVCIEPCSPTDPFLATFDSIQPLRESDSNLQPLGLHDEVKKYHVDEWKLDLKKASEDALEATFQRTVMMSMFDRCRLMYNLKDNNQPILDFAVESLWNCPFMPTLALRTKNPARERLLSRPKPDISIAFRLLSIIEKGYANYIPNSTKRIMAYEGYNITRSQRVFHFLMIEAKNTDKTSGDMDGMLQSLNSASQSLHCLYEFFNEADRQEVECDKPCCVQESLDIATGGQEPSVSAASDQESCPRKKDTFVERFFKEVRVFTAVSTGDAIIIRVHRACPASKLPFPDHKDRPSFQGLILPDYPLQFEYNELIRLLGDALSREKLVGTLEKIMVDYGIGQLRPLLKEAAKVIVNKFYRWQEEKGTLYEFGMRHYSHGQVVPPLSTRTSRAGSQDTRQSSVSATSIPQRVTDDSIAAQVSSTAKSQLGPSNNKRKRR